MILVRDPNTEICEPNLHKFLIDVVLPTEQKSKTEDEHPNRLRHRVDTLEPTKTNFRMLMDADDRAKDLIDIDDPNRDSLKHDAQLLEPIPSMPCMEYSRLDSLAKLRRDILELTASVLRKLAAPRE